jgi:hypothetical protein
VTVCVAALCDDNTTIIGASDRMLTSGTGDIEFEPPQTKIVNLTSSIAIMIAGDAILQTEIMLNVSADVNKRIQDNPKQWWTVQEVASLYSHYYSQAQVQRSEKAILAPLSLDRDSFINRQQVMAPSLVTQLAEQLINFEISRVETIFTGVDPTGAHIYVADNGHISCLDSIGFAAIGVGRGHANSQFMFAAHTRFRPGPETLLLAFSAKKRAEVAPGVGRDTDMFIIGPELGSYKSIGEHVLVSLERIYKTSQKKEQSARKKAEKSINEYLTQLSSEQTTKTQEANPASETVSSSNGTTKRPNGPEKEDKENKP